MGTQSWPTNDSTEISADRGSSIAIGTKDRDGKVWNGYEFVTLERYAQQRAQDYPAGLPPLPLEYPLTCRAKFDLPDHDPRPMHGACSSPDEHGVGCLLADDDDTFIDLDPPGDML